MNTDINFQRNIINLINITTTLTNEHNTVPTQSMKNNNDNIKNILAYAIPLSCLTIIVFIIVIIGVRQRRRVLDKWISLKRMRNTNPRFLHSTGLRRDSEFDSYNHDDIKPTSTSQENRLNKERQYNLATIT